MTDLTLRAATPADILKLHRLMRDFAVYERIEHRFYLTEASLHEALFGRRPLIESALADSDNAILGFALWLVFFGTISGTCGMFVDNLFVAEPYRGRGIGLALFRHIARIAVEKQYSVVQWDVNRLNARAIEFYRRLGAQPVSNDLFMEELRGDALLALARD
jgi:GNAT superfamily N-acetyltransferase